MGSAECILWLCCSQDGGRLLGGAGDCGVPTPCKLELACERKMGLGCCGLGGGCSCPSNATQEVCASLTPPDLVPEVPASLFKRERRDSNGAVDGRGIPDTPISPLPCLPLPFPKIPPSPGTSPQSPVPLGSGGSNNALFSSSSSSSSSSPLSSISSPTGSLASLFGGSQGSRSQQLASSLKGSSSSSSINSNNKNGSSNNSNNNSSSINRSASCSNLASPPSFSSKSIPAAASSSASNSKAATPTEERDVVCQWKACGTVVNPADLLEHLRIQHVDTQKDEEKFVCEWESCKVAGKTSCSMSWLERHVITHGGHKPFRCILPNCGARFPSQVALHRHVNNHFASEGQASTGRANRSRGEESTTRVVRKRNKLKRRRPQFVRNGDFFDTGIMDHLRQQLWDLTEKTQVNPSSSLHHITFQGAVKARRTDDNGKESFLLHWTPDSVLEEAWVASSQVDSNRQRSLPLSHLPAASLASVHPLLYRRHRFRKHRRK